MGVEKTEEWRDVQGYEGAYQVSNLGSVRSVPRLDNRNRRWKGRVLKLCRNHDGYNIVTVCQDGKAKSLRVSRLVAEVFVPNPEGLPTVAHKNHVRHDNRVENLEWSTHSVNVQSSYDENGKKGNLYGVRGRPIIRVCPETGKEQPYEAVTIAARENKISPECIHKSARGSFKAAGFIWRFLD